MRRRAPKLIFFGPNNETLSSVANIFQWKTLIKKRNIDFCFRSIEHFWKLFLTQIRLHQKIVFPCTETFTMFSCHTITNPWCHVVSQALQAAFWCASVALGLTCVFMKHSWNRGEQPSGEWAKILFAFSDKIMWSVFLSWITYACATARGGEAGSCLLFLRLWVNFKS